MAFRDKPAKGPRSAGSALKKNGPRGKSFDPSKKKPKPGHAGERLASAAKPSAKPAPAAEVEPERISKLLARAGIASRRDIERMIGEGRVRLNGSVLDTPVVNVTLADRIEVDGVLVEAIERTRLWLYHKPAGLVTTNKDPEGRPTIFDRMPADLPRVVTIGRLDINTEGLLLLTNDGGLARVLELPTTGWLRRYRVRAYGDISQEQLDELKEGIAVDGVLYGPIEATVDRRQGHNVWLTMGLREGKNREIKNVLGALGLDVNRLIRLSYGPFQLADLPEGAVQEVRGRMLRDQLGARLIEEAGADFDAPILHQAGQAKDEDEKKPVQRGADWRPDDRRPEHGRKKDERPAAAQREKPGERSERLRGRLDTKPGKDVFERKEGGKGSGKGAARDGDKPGARKPPAAPQRRRAANVWIAPGARPMGPKRAAEKAEADRRQAEKDERQRSRPAGKPGPKRIEGRTEGKQARSAGAAKRLFDKRGEAAAPGGAGKAKRPQSSRSGADKRGRPEGAKGAAKSDGKRGGDAPRPSGNRPRGRGDADRRR